MDQSNIKHVTATGDVTTTDTYLRSVVLTGGSDAATLVVKAGGSGGTTILTVKAAAGATAPPILLDDLYCDGGVHATLTGTSPAAMFLHG